MTQKSLIIKCLFRSGDCKGCPYTEACKKYIAKFGDLPDEDDEIHPERYVYEEI